MLKRYELVLTRDGSDGRGPNRVDTFTWGVSYNDAYVRVTNIIDDPTWDGWSFELATRATLIK